MLKNKHAENVLSFRGFCLHVFKYFSVALTLNRIVFCIHESVSTGERLEYINTSSHVPPGPLTDKNMGMKKRDLI